MILNRIVPVLPFVISSLVVSSILRVPRLLEFYEESRLQPTAIISDVLPPLSITNVTLGDDANTTTTDATILLPATRPPLSSLILDARKGFVRNRNGGRNQTVIGDPQFLLDFAIVGFPKCGTSTLVALLQAHPEAQIKKMEMQALSYSEPATAIWNLYTRLPEGNYKRGYKSPFDITNKGGAMDSMRQYFPKTKLIVGVRHPIRWFESFYNFRLQRGVQMPDPYQLLKRQVHGFGVQAANFHVSLAKLGKTSATMNSIVEMKQQFPQQFQNNVTFMTPIPNDVFFYDMEQLADTNITQCLQFRHDLQLYLGLTTTTTETTTTTTMPPSLPRANQGKVTPPAVSSREYIDICNATYDELRIKLLQISQQASTWIQTYFLNGDGVYVSSRDYLEEILEKWMVDPCMYKTERS